MWRAAGRDSAFCCFFNDTATTEIYTLSLHDALPICHLGKVDLEAALKKWRGDHEDDEQDQYHVDQRGHVDLRHRAACRAGVHHAATFPIRRSRNSLVNSPVACPNSRS